MTNKRLEVNQRTTKPLLDLIAKAESDGNYNAYYGNAGNTSINFTDMSISEVQAWQADYVAKGSVSSAVGRYQLLDSTLAGLITEKNIDPSRKFDEATQDELARALLERRGVTRFVNDEMSSQEFSAELAKEWAGLPKVIGENSEDSYYASDGLNKSNVSSSEVIKNVNKITAK